MIVELGRGYLLDLSAVCAVRMRERALLVTFRGGNYSSAFMFPSDADAENGFERIKAAYDAREDTDRTQTYWD